MARRLARPSLFRPWLLALEDRAVPAVVLSDNLSNPTTGADTASGTTWLASSFLTDGPAHALTSATLKLAQLTAGAAEVDLYSNAVRQPGTQLAALTSPAGYSSTAADTVFTAAGVALAANTTYWVVLKAPSGSFDWRSTTDISGTPAATFQHTHAASPDSGATWTTSDLAPNLLRVTADEPTAVAFSTATYTVNEGAGSATVTLTRTGVLTAAQSVTLSATGGTATSADYGGLPVTVTFPAGAASATATLAVTDDSLVEGDETVVLALSNPTSPAVLGKLSAATLTITDNDSSVQFAAGSTAVTVTESAGTTTLNLTRAGDLSRAVSVTVGAVGGSASPADTTGLPATATFAVGAATATVTLGVVADTLVEGDETLALALTGPTGGATIGAAGTAQVTITDDDSAFAFANPTAAVGEGAGTVSLTVTRTGVTTAAATVDIQVTGGTAVAADYTGLPATLNFAAGETSKTITLTIVDDALVESDETLVLGLVNATGSTIGTQSNDTLTIVDNGSLAAPGVVSVADVTVSGTEGGTVRVRLTRTGGTSGAVSVTLAATGGTATSADYTGLPATVTFADGQTAASFTLALTDDLLVEGPETAVFTISAPTGGATLGTATTSTLTLADNDVAGPVQFGASAYQVDEAAGTVTLTVTRTGSTASPGTVDFATAAGSAGSDDYTPTSGTLTFAAGQASATFTVPILQDALAEGPESFTVSLSNPTGGAVLGSPTTAGVLILDETAAVGFVATAVSVNEAAGTVTLTVARTGTVSAAGSVAYATADGTAVAGTDYTAATGILSFAAGQTSATFAVPILNNAVFAGDRTFTVSLTASGGELTLGASATATVTIAEDEIGQPGTVAFSAAAYSVAEGAGTVTLTLTRTGGSDGAVTVLVSATGGTATSGSDYSGLPVTVRFAAGQTTATVTLTLTDDALVEGDETVLLGLTVLTGGAALGGQATATLTISDNDLAPAAGVIAFDQAEYRTPAGTAPSVTLVRTVGRTGAVSVVVTAVGGPVAGLPATVTFADGQTSATLAVPSAGTGTVQLALGSPTGGAAVGNQSTASLAPVSSAGTVAFGSPTYSAAENGRSVAVTLVRTGGRSGVLTATVSASGGTATAGSDYNGLPLTVTFADGQTAATISLTLVDDNLIEGPETLSLAVGSSTSVLTIADREQLTAVATGSGVGTVTVYAAGGAVLRTFQAFGSGGARAATGDVNGDGIDDVVAGAGPGGVSAVRVFDGRTGAELASFTAFEASFTGGVSVAAGDMDGDGKAEVVVTPDQGGGPVVAVYSGASLAAGGAGQLARFFGIADEAFRGGARGSLGDVSGDGRADLLVSAGFLGGPRLALYDGAGVAAGQTPRRLIPDFFAFEDTLRNGAFVALGDFDGDGRADLVAGGGPSGGPRVRVFSGAGLLAAPAFTNLDQVPASAQFANFFAGDSALRGGVRVAAGDFDGDGVTDLLTGSGDGEPSRVREYDGTTVRAGANSPDATLDPFAATFAGGVYVG